MIDRKLVIKVAIVVVFVGLCLGNFLATKARGDQTVSTIQTPSGQPISFLQFIAEQDGALVRFRFLTPEIGATLSYVDVAPDFQALCDEQVMPVLSANELRPDQIVLSMSAQDIPFGEDDPAVLQFFEIFRPENGLCIWEEF